MATKLKLIGVKLPAEMHERVARLAGQLNKSMSETARELIERGLDAPEAVPGNWAMHSLLREMKELKSASEKGGKAAALAQFYARAAAVGDDAEGKKLDNEAQEFLKEWLKKN